MDFFTRDIRHAFRKLLRTPALSAVTVLTLALGIGLTTMMFSIVYGVFWRGLPFDHPEQLIHLERNNPAAGIDGMEVPIHDFVDWRAEQEAFEDIAAFYSGTVNLSGEERAERFDGAFITPEAFQLLRVKPLMGRTFIEDERGPAADPVVVLGYRVWQDRYAGDPDILGRSIRVNGRPSTVVGVMPEGFRFPVNEDLWVPLPLDPLTLKRGEGQTLEVFGRLKPDVSLDRAAAGMNGIAARLATDYPETNEGVGVVAKPYTQEFVGGDEMTSLITAMLAGAFFVLLIACANVASLLLARAVQRTRELGVRSAMGARRARLVGHFLLEAFAIAVIGALLGLSIAWVGVAWFNRAIAETAPPFWFLVRVDGVSLAVALGAALVATVASGGLPAWQAARADIAAILKDESRGASGFRIGRLTRGLVVLEIALSCALLVVAALTIRSVVRLNTLDFPFPTDDVLTARLGLMESEYPDTLSLQQFYSELETALNATPGVDAASLAAQLPGFFAPWSPLGVEGATYAEDRDYPMVHRIPVGTEFFRTFQVGARAGRLVEASDRQGALPVAVVNESFERRYLEGDALGKRIRFGRSDATAPWRTVVGVVPDLLAGGVSGEDPEAVYLPLAQADPRFVSIAVRTRGDAAAAAPDVRRAVEGLDPDLPLYWVAPLGDRIDQANWQYGLLGGLFGTLGLAALFLAAIGLYAVMAFAVGQRTREIGVRMALGARARDVVGMVMRQGLVQIGIGLLGGIGLAVGLAHVMAGLLFGIDPRDPTAFGATILVLGAAGMLASLLPARRATRVEPVEALRSE